MVTHFQQLLASQLPLWKEASEIECLLSLPFLMFTQPLCSAQHTSGAVFTRSLGRGCLTGSVLAFHVSFSGLGTQKPQRGMHT